VHFSTLTAEPFNLQLDDEILVKVTANNVYGDSAKSDATSAGLVQLVPFPPVNLASDPAVTDATRIKFTWEDPLEDGGSPILDYDVYWDQGSTISSVVLLASDLTVREYQTTASLTSGELYSFYVSARNAVGEGQLSDPLSVYAATIPDAPLAVVNVPGVTTGFQVGLNWQNGLYDGGSPVLDYLVSFRASGSAENYSVYGKVFTTQRAEITGLNPGQSYEFVVQSRNAVGYRDGLSLYSQSLDVAAVQVPDAPTGLSDVPSVTLEDRIGLTWTAPTFDGGSLLIDYRLYSDQASNNWVIFAENIIGTAYTAEGLTRGLVYKFRVEARN
jgi:titin